MSLVITARHLSKTYLTPTQETVHALKNVSLAVEKGEFVTLLGASGCGKSTLLRLIADLEPPTHGELLVNGKSPREARLHRDYGIVFQEATLYDWRTIRDNVQLPLEIVGLPAIERHTRTQALLELVELADFADHYPRQLSGGMQQRVAIARALAFQPSLLLMDEPFSALDEFTRERMNLELLNLWQRTGITVVFVTHSITEAVFLSQRIVVMSPRPGRIIHLIDNPLPYPRPSHTRETPEFFAQVTRVRELLREAQSL